MIRAARSATLLVAFYVFTSAATAHAECAWVLWEKWDRMPEKKGAWTGKLQTAWEIKAALPKFEQCHDTLKRAWNRGIENQKTTSKESRSGAEVFFNPEEVGFYRVTFKDATWVYNFYCLPDTVDPRGPKGK